MENQVYKLPTNLDLDYLRSFTGSEGTILNPIEDKDGNHIVSQGEFNGGEFSSVKSTLEGEGYTFTLIDFNAKTPPLEELD